MEGKVNGAERKRKGKNKGKEAHLRPRTFVNLHRDGQNRLRRLLEVLPEALVRALDALLDVRGLRGVAAADLEAFVVGETVAERERVARGRGVTGDGRRGREGFGGDGAGEAGAEDVLCLLEDDLSSVGEFGSNVDRFEGRLLCESLCALLETTDDTAVLAVLFDREEDQVGDS